MVAPEQTIPPAGPYGEIYDRGYRHYEGQRLGRRHAFGALARYSIKRSLGIKKSWTAKIIPIILYVAVAIPVVVSIGIKAFLPENNPIEYEDLMILLFSIQGLFVATIAPEMLCGDRRENVLALYFSRAITRLDYLLAKLVATGVLTLTISLLPSAIYWLGLQLLADHPLGAIRDNVGDLGRICLSGALIAFYLGAIGLTVSSFTGRKMIAVAIIVIGFVVSTSLSHALAAAFTDERLLQYLIFLSPAETTAAMLFTLFEIDIEPHPDFGELLPVWQYVGVMVAVVVASVGIMSWRYVPED
jgi:ABC-2 type transport system permease protein